MTNSSSSHKALLCCVSLLASCGTSETPTLTVAQYNVSLLSTPKLSAVAHPQVQAAVEILTRVSPDVIAINEIAYDIPSGTSPSPGVFNGGAKNAERLAAKLNETNTGAPYDYTLITLGNAGYPWTGFDAAKHDPYFEWLGAARVKGSLNMAIISRYPIIEDEVRVITDLAWTDLPQSERAALEADLGMQIPEGAPLLARAILVAPVNVDGTVVYMLMLHATAPIPEPNSYRNHDELTAMRLLLDGKLPKQAPLPADARFVLAGDFNADPDHGDAFPESAGQLLGHPLVEPFQPEGAGTGGKSPQLNTFSKPCPLGGGPEADPSIQFQLDYLLPSKTLGAPIEGGMFFPDRDTQPDDWALACQGSDHMMLWAKLRL